MHRAKKNFEAYNIKVTPFAVDFINSHRKIVFMDFLPSAASFNKSSLVIRELIGILYYHLKY